jgi:hypothetical protein
MCLCFPQITWKGAGQTFAALATIKIAQTSLASHVMSHLALAS